MRSSVSLRRTLEQAKHCIEEALSVIEANEYPKLAAEDVRQAETLLREVCIPELARLEDDWKKWDR